MQETVLLELLGDLEKLKSSQKQKREDLRVRIGQQIKFIRETAKLTQPDFAKILGVSRVAIANYESGLRQSISKVAAEKIIKACTRGKK